MINSNMWQRMRERVLHTTEKNSHLKFLFIVGVLDFIDQIKLHWAKDFYISIKMNEKKMKRSNREKKK